MKEHPQMYRVRPVSALGLRLLAIREQIEAAAERGETKLLDREGLESEMKSDLDEFDRQPLSAEETTALLGELIAWVGRLETENRVFRSLLLRRGIVSGEELEEMLTLEKAQHVHELEIEAIKRGIVPLDYSGA